MVSDIEQCSRKKPQLLTFSKVFSYICGVVHAFVIQVHRKKSNWIKGSVHDACVRACFRLFRQKIKNRLGEGFTSLLAR